MLLPINSFLLVALDNILVIFFVPKFHPPTPINVCNLGFACFKLVNFSYLEMNQTQQLLACTSRSLYFRYTCIYYACGRGDL